MTEYIIVVKKVEKYKVNLKADSDEQAKDEAVRRISGEKGHLYSEGYYYTEEIVND